MCLFHGDIKLLQITVALKPWVFLTTHSQLGQHEVEPGWRLKTRYTLFSEELGLRSVKRVLGGGDGDHEVCTVIAEGYTLVPL